MNKGLKYILSLILAGTVAQDDVLFNKDDVLFNTIILYLTNLHFRSELPYL
jgi:hypothetical protein